MSDRERTDAGTYAETVTLDAVRDVFDAVRGPVVTSSDVADALDCTTEAARQKLTRLYDRGEVDKRKTGRTVVYWRTDTDAESGREPAVTPSGDRADRSDVPTDAGDTRPATGGEDVEEIDAALAALDTTDDRRAAVRGCVEYLREHETGRKSEFVDAVYSDHPAGFGSAGGWWNKIGKEYLQTVADAVGPLTPPPAEGGHTWRWDAPDAGEGGEE